MLIYNHPVRMLHIYDTTYADAAAASLHTTAPVHHAPRGRKLRRFHDSGPPPRLRLFALSLSSDPQASLFNSFSILQSRAESPFSILHSPSASRSVRMTITVRSLVARIDWNFSSLFVQKFQ